MGIHRLEADGTSGSALQAAREDSEQPSKYLSGPRLMLIGLGLFLMGPILMFVGGRLIVAGGGPPGPRLLLSLLGLGSALCYLGGIGLVIGGAIGTAVQAFLRR